MFFSSLAYLLFLLVATIGLYLMPGRLQWIWLLVCSVFFYYTLLPVYLILFLVLVLLNYFLGIAIEKSKARGRLVFVFSILLNLIVLAFFKYFGLIELYFSGIKRISGTDPLLKIILPIGLSFFVFTVLSYLIEIKRGKIKSEKHLGIFAASLLFFPKIMQGPIEKPYKILPQFKEKKIFSYDLLGDGLKLILLGYFKKLVIADRIALYVDAVYGNYEFHNGLSLILATILYSIQIYADFSGYTDIALGSARLLGFNLTNNFNRPYFANSIKEFWNRWHISFSVWLRDYLFLPLAVFFAGKTKNPRYLGLKADKWIFMGASIITFAICGIWHGEGLNFLIWGLLFGIYLTLANWTLDFSKRIRKILHVSKKSMSYKIYGIICTFILVSFAWIFFRAETFNDAIAIIHRILTESKGSLFIDYEVFFAASIGIAVLFAKELIEEFLPLKVKQLFIPHDLLRLFSYATLAACIVLLGVFDSSQFIYFQF
jgi:D-alanyl-lipoteichoic acid acyltransferase DltB (MBOAT superfamily)